MQDLQEAVAPATADPVEEFKDFAYIISHDLAGPVRSIAAFSQLLKEDFPQLPNNDGELHLDLVLESAQKLNDMIQGLLAFSRLNTVPRAPTQVDLEMVLARCHMEFQPILDLWKGQLSYPRMPEITADSNRMFTLFSALIDNAIKFHRRDNPPDVRIGVIERHDHWEFSVSDNGIGVDPLFFDDVFRPLRKLHTDEAYPGVGMGLTLARKIVLQHGGQIWFDPAPARGATVHFTLAKVPPGARTIA